MEAQQLNLKDIHLPDAIGWWPPAIGWWLSAILIPLLCFAFFWLYKRIMRKTATKTAQKHLLKIKNDTETNDTSKLKQLSELLRRVAISSSPRNEVASLTGNAWLEYLDSSVQGSPFTQGIGTVFANAHYKKQSELNLDIPLLIKLCEDWLKFQNKK